MDGKGRYLDNIFIERLWRSLKYEEVFIKAYGSVAEARRGIGGWLAFYNDERPHQALGYRTPREVFEAALPVDMWTAAPNGCASPRPRRSAKRRGKPGGMLAFAHIPTGPTASRNRFISRRKSDNLSPAAARIARIQASRPGRDSLLTPPSPVQALGSTSVAEI